LSNILSLMCVLEPFSFLFDRLLFTVCKFTLFVTLNFCIWCHSVFLFLPHNLIGFSIMLHLFLNSHLRAEQCSKGVSMVSRCIRDINYDYVTRI